MKRSKRQIYSGFYGIAVVAMLACCATSVFAEEVWELPPPPEVGRPSVDLAMLRTKVAIEDVQAEVVDNEVTPEVQAVLVKLREEANPRQRMERGLLEALQRSIPGHREGLIVESIQLPDCRDLGGDSWQPEFEFRWPQRPFGMVSYNATIRGAGGSVIKRFSGSLRIDYQSQAVQARRAIKRGDTLHAEDLTLRPVRLSEIPRDAYTSIDQIVDQEAKSNIGPFQWLTDKQVQRPMLVERNDVVMMRIERGPLSISARGLTREAGGLRDVIRVMNLQSKKEIYARVVSRDEVQVIF